MANIMTQKKKAVKRSKDLVFALGTDPKKKGKPDALGFQTFWLCVIRHVISSVVKECVFNLLGQNASELNYSEK